MSDPVTPVRIPGGERIIGTPDAPLSAPAAPAPAVPPTMRDGRDAPRAPGAVIGAVPSSPGAPDPRLVVDRGAEEQRNTREARADEEASKPSFFRSALEVMETVARALPGIGFFVNLLSLLIRCAMIVYDLITGKNVDWKQQGLRALGDVAGMFVPFLGAAAHAGLNYWFSNEGSEILGGSNRLWEGDREVRSAFEYWPKRLVANVGGWLGNDGTGTETPREASVAAPSRPPAASVTVAPGPAAPPAEPRAPAAVAPGRQREILGV